MTQKENIRNSVRAARYGLPFTSSSFVSEWDWECNCCHKQQKPGSLRIGEDQSRSLCIRCARSLKQKTAMKTLERCVSSFIGVITIRWEKYREASWTIILASVAIAAATGVTTLIYEAIDWVGVSDTSVTYGIIGDVSHRDDGRVDEIIETPLGNDLWYDVEGRSWDVKGEKIKVVYQRSRLSHKFSASQIWNEGK